MNTTQINRILTKHVKYFQGVYPIDLLLSAITKPAITIVNLDKHYTPRSHWVVLCFFDSGCAEYFDSYGLPPLKLEIMAYFQRHSISWKFNRHRLQGLTAKICGHFCCIYAHHRAQGLSMTSFVKSFKPARYSCNGTKTVTMFQAHFGECPACSHENQQQQQQSSKSHV